MNTKKTIIINRKLVRDLVLGAVVSAVALAPNAFGASSSLPTSAPLSISSKLRSAITRMDLAQIDGALQNISTAPGNNYNSAPGTPGFTAASNYVVSTLQNAGYSPTLQPFTFGFFRQNALPVFQQVTPNSVSYTYAT